MISPAAAICTATDSRCVAYDTQERADQVVRSYSAVLSKPVLARLGERLQQLHHLW